MKTANITDLYSVKKKTLIEILDSYVMNEPNKLGFNTKELYEKYHKLSNFNEKTKMLDFLLNN